MSAVGEREKEERQLHFLKVGKTTEMLARDLFFVGLTVAELTLVRLNGEALQLVEVARQEPPKVKTSKGGFNTPAFRVLCPRGM